MTTPLPRRLLSAALTFLSAFAFISCGGVGQDGTGAAPPDSYTTGVVNGFGSVIVNGIHFDVRNASISVDGTSGRRETDLRTGMVVAVTGRVADDGLTGTATRLVYESVLRGQVQSIGTDGQSLQVLGQTVRVDDTTLYAGADGLSDFTVGQQVQISGLRAADGSLRATLVVREAASAERQFVATVTAINGSIVQLAGLSVDVSTAQFSDLTLATLAAGQVLRVELQAAPVGGAATATRVRLIDTRSGDVLTKQQRQGFVTQWNALASTFVLNGQTVQLTATTQYQDGSLAQLANGARVEVRGLRGSDGVLRADKLRFLRSVLTAYGRGRVALVEAANQRFRLLDPTGIEVRVRADTLMHDNAGGTLTLANLAINQDVVVLGVANGNQIDADVVIRLATNPIGSGLGGPAQSITANGFSLLGVPVTTGLGTNFFDLQGNAMSSSAFYASLASGDLVRAEGAYVGGTLVVGTVRQAR